EYGIHRSTIFMGFKKHNLKTLRKNDIYNEMLSNQILKMYTDGYSMNRISSYFGISTRIIHSILHSNNINIKKLWEYDSYQKHNINELFDKIDTPEKAYFLGFLYADGNVNKNLNQVTLKLKESDIHILNDIKKTFEIGNKLYFDRPANINAENQYSLKIINKKIRDNFVKHGVIPRKTWKLSYPFWLEKHLHSHFVRGYFDGDGCLSIDYKRNNATISICGTWQMCSDLKFIFENYVGVKSVISSDRKIFRIIIRRYSSVLDTCAWMYKGANLKLNRKYEKYQCVMEMK